MADYRRDYDGRHRRPAREGADRTDQVRSWFGDDKARQHRGNDERDDRFPYGGDRDADHDDWRSEPHLDGDRDERGSRWDGPRDDRDNGGYYAAQVFGAYRTDDRPYHDRHRSDRPYEAYRDRDDMRNGGISGRPRHSTSDAANEYFRAARAQRNELLRHEAQGRYESRSPFVGRGPKDYRRSDDRVREEVCDCMTDDPMLDASEITVQVSDGVVMLNGSVTSREQKRRAEDVAERISGVKDVANQLRVSREATGHAQTAARPVAQSDTGTPSKSSSTTT
jgi:osmotically-inducible protein OsmY